MSALQEEQLVEDTGAVVEKIREKYITGTTKPRELVE